LHGRRKEAKSTKRDNFSGKRNEGEVVSVRGGGKKLRGEGEIRESPSMKKGGGRRGAGAV